MSDEEYTGEWDDDMEQALETALQRALDEPMPRDLREQIADLIEPHTINSSIKHGDVMEAIDIAFPVIRDYLSAQGATTDDNAGG